MRIAMLSAPPVTTNGWGRYARSLVIALAEQGHQIVMITANNAPPQADLRDVPLAAYHRLLPSVVPMGRAVGLRTLLARPAVARLTADCDVVHVEAEPYMLASPASRRGVVTAHGTYLPNLAQRSSLRVLYRRGFQRATVICVSRYTERRVKAVSPDLKTVVIPNGVDWQRFMQPGTPQVKHGPTVLAVGAIKPRKGYHILIQAMKIVRRTIPDVQAVCIGSGQESGYFQNLKSQLEHDGMTDCVHFLGRVAEDVLLGWYHSADLFALPVVTTSDQFEGFGLIYLEANAAGLPAIGTLDSGAEDAIHDGETGLLVPQQDAQATADAIIRLLTDGTLRKRMGESALTHAREYSWERTARSVVETYKNT